MVRAEEQCCRRRVCRRSRCGHRCDRAEPRSVAVVRSRHPPLPATPVSVQCRVSHRGDQDSRRGLGPWTSAAWILGVATGDPAWLTWRCTRRRPRRSCAAVGAGERPTLEASFRGLVGESRNHLRQSRFNGSGYGTTGSLRCRTTGAQGPPPARIRVNLWSRRLAR